MAQLRMAQLLDVVEQLRSPQLRLQQLRPPVVPTAAQLPTPAQPVRR